LKGSQTTLEKMNYLDYLYSILDSARFFCQGKRT